MNRLCAFDVALDGRRFLTVKPLGASSERKRVLVVSNWIAEFVPTP